MANIGNDCMVPWPWYNMVRRCATAGSATSWCQKHQFWAAGAGAYAVETQRIGAKSALALANAGSCSVEKGHLCLNVHHV